MTRIYFTLICIACVLILSLAACNGQGGLALFSSPTSSPTITLTVTIPPSLTPTPSATLTPSDTPSPTPTDTSTPTASNTPTFTPSKTPTVTFTPSSTPSPTISPTPTIDFPDVIINVGSAHCRYGPGKAYLHAADLFEGDHGFVWNRNYASTWLWVRFDKLHYACWVAASVTEIDGDISDLSNYSPALPHSTLYESPKNIAATRSGNQVIITWEEVWMTEDDDRGYLIEARVCQNGYLIDMAVHTNGTSYTFLDEKKCTGESKGRLYAVEKHGYTDAVQIPWP